MSMQRLVDWVGEHGGFLHSGVEVTEDGCMGRSLVAKEDLASGTEVLATPYACSLSALNALVDDSLPVLKENADSFSMTALGTFYLMAQWIDRENSFYKPFLDILPTPETGIGTPFWFDELDLQWLKGTDLETSFDSRQALWRSYWRDGTAILRDGGMDVSQYTWDLCKWAASIFTSRSLPSRALRPMGDNNTWLTYMQGPGGRRTVYYNWDSTQDKTRKDFPVLIPVMDMLNHHPRGKVDWIYGGSDFKLNLASSVAAGQQVFNNYGPKSNSELLLGYGFTVDRNPYDVVYETLKAPPKPLRNLLNRYTSISCFKGSKGATFGLRMCDRSKDPLEQVPSPYSGGECSSGHGSAYARIWQCFDPILLTLFDYFVAYESGLLIDEPTTRERAFDPATASTLPRIAYLLVCSLRPKIEKILHVDGTLHSSPQNEKQRHAKAYRTGQLDILLSLQWGLTQFNRSFRPDMVTLLGSQDKAGSVMLTLGEMLQLTDVLPGGFARQLRDGLNVIFGKRPSGPQDDVAMVLAGSVAEPYAWATVMCFLALLLQAIDELSDEGVDGSALITVRKARWLLQPHVVGLLHEYGSEEFYPAEMGADTPTPEQGEDESDEVAERVLQGIRGAAEQTWAAGPAAPVNVWASRRWSERSLLDWGLRVTRSKGVPMSNDDGDAMLVVYMHKYGG